MQISITAPEIIAKLVEKSKEGDVGAARLLLERFAPATKPTEEQTSLDLGDGTLTEKGHAITLPWRRKRVFDSLATPLRVDDLRAACRPSTARART